MARRELTFRVFVSSTFRDLIAERNALQQNVFPRLRAYCLEKEARFQAIDLRWGVSEEAALDQQTMKICLQELNRCQTVSPRPNFIVLLGDRYGWRPAPAAIAASEFEALRSSTPEKKQALLNGWYDRDDNAIPAQYYLKPRTVHEDAAARDAEATTWEEIEFQLRELLTDAARHVFSDPADPRRHRYEDSAAHQEIRYGALKSDDLARQDAARHVYCYFRDISDMPEDERAKDYRDIKNGGIDHKAGQRLEALKTELGSIFPVPGEHIYKYKGSWNNGEPRSDLTALCDRVEQDLKAIIDAELSTFEELPKLDREIDAHLDFGRARREQFVGREQELQQIREYVDSSINRPIIVYGVSGSGKTALMAEASERIAEEWRPGARVLTRFIGATPASSEIRSLFDGLCDQLARFETIPRVAPVELSKLVGQFLLGLTLATAERPVVVLLDALEQLSTTDGAREFQWLPEELPDNVKLIVSVLDANGPDGECWRTLHERVPEAGRLRINPLTLDEGDALLTSWLNVAHRTLQPDQRQKVLTGFSANGLPLYLKLAFEQARYWKSSDVPLSLGGDVAALLNGMLARLEDERNHGQLVTSRALGSLAAARRGLTDEELLGVLSSDQSVLADFRKRSPRSPDISEVPVVVWSRLFADLEPYLANRRTGATTVMTFYHRQVGQAITKRYLEGSKQSYAGLAEYFRRQPLTERRVDELPWQWAQAEDWEQLSRLLGDIAFLNAALQLNEYDVRDYWSQIEARSAHRMLNTYQRVLEGAPRDLDSIGDLPSLLHKTGHVDEALRLYELEVDEYRRRGNRGRLVGALGNKAAILMNRDVEATMTLLKEQERICRELVDENLPALRVKQIVTPERIRALRTLREGVWSLSASLGNQAVILQAQGDLDGTMTRLKEEERLNREFKNDDALPVCLGKQALVLRAKSDLDGAIVLLKEQERISRQLGNVDSLHVALNNQGLIEYDRHDVDRAMALFKGAEQICRKLGAKEGLYHSVGNQAVVLKDRGDLAGALTLRKEEERICRELGHKDALQTSLWNQALILQACGDLDGSLALLQEQERICRELGNKEALLQSLRTQGAILKDRGDTDGALTLNKEEERICRELGNKKRLWQVLGNHAAMLKDHGDFDRALALRTEQEHISRELGDKDALQSSLGNQAAILLAQGNLDGAMALFEEQERICREFGNVDNLQRLLGNRAYILCTRGDLDGAMDLFKEQAQICRELGNKDSLQRSLWNQARTLQERGDLAGAMILLKEQERSCRECGNKGGLQSSLESQGVILQAQGNLDEAMELFKEDEQICRELGNVEALARSLANQAVVLADGSAVRALELASEAHRLASDHGLTALLGQTAQLVRSVRRRVDARDRNWAPDSPSRPVKEISKLHPESAVEGAGRQRTQYEQALARWRALPAWKRWLVAKPERPEGT